MKVSFWKLMLAYFIDWIIVFIGSAVVGVILGTIFGAAFGAAGMDPQVVASVVMLVAFPFGIVLHCLYFSLMEHYLGSSVGKMAMKIVVTPKN